MGFKVCPGCGSEIGLLVNVCPHCDKKQLRHPKRGEEVKSKVLFICGVCGEVEVDAWGDDYHYVYQGMGVSQYVCLKCGKRPFEEVWEALEKGASYIGDKKAEDILDKNVSELKP